MTIEGRTAIVTGGAVRIGRAIVERLAERGARILLHCGRSVDEAAAVCQQLRQQGRTVEFVSADLAEPVRAADTIFAALRTTFGTADILVNSAAIFENGTLDETTEASWDRHHAINLKAPFFLSQSFARQLPPGTAGDIVNIIDWRGTHPVPGQAAYTVAKAGLTAMTQLLAQELGARIRVNGVAPGAILPPPGFDRREFEALAGRIPVQRVGGPHNIADAVEFLLTNDFVNGEILHVTGGQQLVVPRDV